MAIRFFIHFQWALVILFFNTFVGVVQASERELRERPTSESPAQVFEKRIMPIFKSSNPSSCVQCHLADIDLKNYILPDAGKTFRSLRDQGLIDLENPEKSKIIKLIERGGEVKNKASITAGESKAEREAFLEWIKACAADPVLAKSPKLDEKDQKGPAAPKEVIRHSRKDQVLDSFEKNVWAWRFRCMNCHTEGTPQNDKLRKENGHRVAWVKKDGAEATMDYLIESRLIDTENPEKSILLRKPLGEKHGGGLKFVVGDQAYKGFRSWIEDVVAIRTNKYTKASDLPPAPNSTELFGTDLWFKLSNIPPAWGEKLLQVRIHSWNDQEKSWSPIPVATSDRMASGKARLWQHNLTLLAAPGSDQAQSWRKSEPKLPPGKYLVRIYIDQGERLSKNWKDEIADSDFVGEIEFQARWRPGYGGMIEADASKVKKGS